MTNIISNHDFAKLPVDSLSNIALTNVIVNTMRGYIHPESLRFLPSHLKQKIIRKLTSSSHYYILNKTLFKIVIHAIVDDKTSDIDFTEVDIDDEILASLNKARNLRYLFLSRVGKTNVTTIGLQNLLKQLTQLNTIVLRYCVGMADSVLECLAENCPNVMYIDIAGCINVTDAGIEKLSKLEKITGLILTKTQLSDEGISSIIKGKYAHKLTQLEISSCLNVTSSGVTIIFSNCPNISMFTFGHVKYAGADSLDFLNNKNTNIKQIFWTISP